MGDYWGANVFADQRNASFAGWTLVIIYYVPGVASVPRQFLVYDGWARMGQSTSPATVTLPGLQTPLVGDTHLQMNMVAWGGNEIYPGAGVKVNGTQLSTSVSPVDNFFNGMIDNSTMAGDVSQPSGISRNPNDANTFGVNIKNMKLPKNIISNNQTSVPVQFTAEFSLYEVGVIAVASDLPGPDFSSSSKTVVQVGGKTPPVPGDVLQYTIVYSNKGQDIADNTVSVDSLPPGTQYVPGSLKVLSGTNWSTATSLTDSPGDDVGYVDATGVHVNLGDGATASTGGRIVIGGSAAYSFQVRLTGDASLQPDQVVSNTAHLNYTAETSGASMTYDTSPATIKVVAPADLAISKSFDQTQAVAGGAPVSAVVTVVNHGPGPAMGVTISDPIPEYWQNVSTSDASSGVSCGVGTIAVSCTVPDLAVGESASVRVSGTVQVTAPMSVLATTNVASVSSVSGDPDLTNNTVSAAVPVVHQADLSVVKTGPASVTPGTTASYSLTVSNAGPAVASNVRVTDVVPDGSTGVLGLTGISSESDGVSCDQTSTQGSSGSGDQSSGGAGSDVSAGGLTSDESGVASLGCAVESLASGGSVTLTVTGKVASNAVAGASFSNEATVMSDTPDLNTANNDSVVSSVVGPPQADVGVVKSVLPESLVAGSQVTYTLTATNHGPSDAAGVVVSDPIPAGISINQVSSDRGSCTTAGQTVSCQVGSLPASSVSDGQGASATITVSGVVGAGVTATSVSNTASVSASTTDPVGSNNTSTVISPVSTQADVTVIMTGSTTSLPNSGDKLSYLVTANNAGPSLARDSSVSVVLPTGLSPDPSSLGTLPTGVTCSQTVSGWSCQLGDIAAGESVAVRLPVMATQTLTQPATATATVGTSTTNTASSGTSASWTLSDDPQADLAVTGLVVDPLVAGGTGLYGLTVSNSNSPNSSIPTLTVTLPDGVTLVPSDADGSQTTTGCVADGQQVTCSRTDPLGVDQTWPVNLSVNVSPDLDNGASVTLSAQVTGTTADPTLSNNTTSIVSPVSASADVQVSSLTWNTFNGLDNPPGAVIPQTTAGSLVWVTVTAANIGTATAKNVSLSVGQNLGLSSVLGNGNPVVMWNDGSASGSTTCTVTDDEITCPIDNGDSGTSIPPNGTVTLSVLFLVPEDLDETGGLGTAQVSTTTAGDQLSNNTGSTPLIIGEGEAQLQVDSSTAVAPGGGGLVTGGQFQYSVDVWQDARPGQDEGTGLYWADAENTIISQVLPAGFHATSVSSTQGTCSISSDGSSISCRVGTVPGTFPQPSDTKVTVSVVGSIDASATSGQATVVATTTTSPAPGSDGSARTTVPLVVGQVADLALSKTADPTDAVSSDGLPVFDAGTQVGYTLTVTNQGPSGSGASTVRDALPLGVSLVTDQSPACSVVTPGDVASGVQEVVVCQINPLSVGASQSIRVVGSTSPLDLRQPGTGPGCVPGQPSDPDDQASTVNQPGCDQYPSTTRMIVNTASITTVNLADRDPDLTNNTASASAIVEAHDALTVTVTPLDTNPTPVGRWTIRSS